MIMNDVIKTKSTKFKGNYKHKKITLRQFIDMFYRSKFNRDDNEELKDGEDINNSSRHRIFNRNDIEELMFMLEDYFEWFLTNEDYDYIYLSSDLVLYRDIDYPRIKRANCVDVKFCCEEGVEDGDFYVTHGKYNWMFLPANELRDDLFKMVEGDYRRNVVADDMRKKAKERNKKNGKRSSK